MTSSDRRPDSSIDAAGPGLRRFSGRPGWDQHPGVRTGRRLRPGEHVVDVFCRVAGSWTYLIMVGIAVLAGVAVALSHDSRAGGLTRLDVGLSALVLAAVSLVLMAARRAERIATELALYNLDQARRATAIAEDLREEMARLHTDVARIAAYAEKEGGRHRPMLGP